MVYALLLGIITASNLSEVDVDLTEACFPFHYSAGTTVLKIADYAYAFGCERLGSSKDEAWKEWRATIQLHHDFDSSYARCIGVFRFQSVGTSTVPEKFCFLVPREYGVDPEYTFAVDNRGMIYTVWYNGACEFGFDQERNSTVVVCNDS